MDNKKINIRFNTLAIILIVIICIAMCPVILQNDTFYTIKIGEHIVKNGITQPDPFSWHDITYTYPHWAYDVMIYLIYSVGGLLGIYISTVVFSSILGFALYYAHNKITNNKITSFILTATTIILLRDYLAARAQLVTYILFAFTILFIEMFMRTKKKRYGIGLVLISLIIANVHIAVWPFFFVVFLPAIGEYLIVLLLETRFKTHRIKFINNLKLKIFKNKNEDYKNKLREQIAIETEKESRYKQKVSEVEANSYKIEVKREGTVKWLILILLIALTMGLFTPLGDAPYTYLIRTMQGNTTKNISEHLPLTLVESSSAIIMLIVSIGIVTFANMKIKLRDLFLLGGLILLMFYTRRQVSLLVLLGMFAINRLVCNLIEKYDPEGTEKMLKLVTKRIGQVVTIVLILLLCYTYGKGRYKELVRDGKAHIIENGKIVLKDSLFINEKSYPVGASKYIKDNIDMSNMRLFNEYNYGSYLILEDIKVFIDSRADLYTKEFNGKEDIFSDFMGISSLDNDYEKVFKKHNITHCIFQKSKVVNKMLAKDENYKELYSDKYFILYERLNVNIDDTENINNESENENNEV